MGADQLDFLDKIKEDIILVANRSSTICNNKAS